MFGIHINYPTWFAQSITTVASVLGFGSSHALESNSAQLFPTSGAMVLFSLKLSLLTYRS
jgi:hypothetical protein